MGLLRRSGAPQSVRRRATAWTSFGIGAALLCVTALSLLLEERPESRHSGRRLEGYWADPLIDQPYQDAPNRGWIVIHILIILYMLLGLNTVCDLYFSGSLEVMVEQWNVKPDVAGATFMAAGGSAPELFTSLIGACVTENDVGFGTIVGSAVFNVLFVIGLCGFVSDEPIKLTWWPLFRDCSFYVFGLSLLATFAANEQIALFEAIILFCAYIVYCILMYNNTRIEAWTDTEFLRAKRWITERPATWASPVATARPDQANQPNPPSNPAPSLLDGQSSVEVAAGTGEQRSDFTPVAFTAACSLKSNRSCKSGKSIKSSQKGSKLGDENIGVASSSGSDVHHLASRRSNQSSHPPAHIHGKMRGAYMAGHAMAERHLERMNSLKLEQCPPPSGRRASEPDSCLEKAPAPARKGLQCFSLQPFRSSKVIDSCMVAADGSSPAPSAVKQTEVRDQPGRPVEEQELSKEKSEDKAQKHREADKAQEESEEKGENEKKEKEEEKEANEEKEEKEEGEEEEDDDLLRKPEGTKDLVLWYLSLPIYIPLSYGIPKPSEKWFLATFGISLLWIAGFAFLLVYCVEILGQVIGIPNIVMGFTLLAAGTSIPDAVSSVAVARLGEGDMAVSSSVGSNIFDILVGLPLPWVIKILIIEGGNYKIRIISPFLVFDVLLLLFMVLCVVLSIHILKWTLNRTLGLCMAALYIFFLAVVLSVEANPSSFQWLMIGD
mmetsp:Transcript_55613/g.120069  ORF Transcript_55613/g.120069 Transcript_55613/m.120069 type:complete len:722 (-) Transcript_55613:99-2264(-)